MATDVTPLVSRLSLVDVPVGDMARSVAFYRDVLGIPLEGDEQWMQATFANGVQFALHPRRQGSDDSASGGIHLNFEVADAADAAARLRAEGLEVGEPRPDENGSSLELADPDGYRVYLFQPQV